MLQLRTIKNQLLPTLDHIAARIVSQGIPIRDACQLTFHELSERLDVEYQTIEDLCRRRLGLNNIDEFHSLIRLWTDNNSDELLRLVKRQSQPVAHDLIDQFFENFADRTAKVSGTNVADQSSGKRSLVLGNMDAETIGVLDERARSRGVSLESEARNILERAVHGGRKDFASWTQHLRARLRDDYVGDATADIRADRDR